MDFLGVFTKEYETKFVLDDLRAAMREFGKYELYECDRPKPPPPAELALRIAGADVILTGWPTPVLPVEILDAPGRRLKYICHLAGQVSPFMPRRFLEAGVLVTNWGDAAIWTFAEGNVALMLACLKEMHRIRPHMLTGPGRTFPYSHPAPTLREKTVGFVGFGAIARTLVDMLRPFLCKFIAFDPYTTGLPDGVERRRSLEEVFSQADIVTVQCGLTPQTTGMIGMEHFSLLRPHAIFINTARGRIIRQAELIEFLKGRPDVMAGIDVYESEPVPADCELPKLPNAICYPHCIGHGGEVFDRLVSRTAAANIRAFCSGGQVKHVITAEKFDRMT
ncbi:MAG: NAD(P)-dependent oxidoreductase [Phycisphaerae bacterium]